MLVHFSEPFRFDQDPLKMDNTRYHGGFRQDELGALVSLCLGRRIKAGGETRWFKSGGDPVGQPVDWGKRQSPVLMLDDDYLVLPDVAGRNAEAGQYFMAGANMDDLHPIKSVPYITSGQYITLIRAARYYQDALWIAESEPNLAWLMIVSALESAAGEYSSTLGTPEEILRESRTDLVKLLQEAGGDELVRKVALLMEPELRATRKFINFVLDFLPTPPPRRPSHLYNQVDWSKAEQRKLLNKIYQYRSNALHGGIPFPYPMNQPPPRVWEDDPAPPEIPEGLGTTALGGTWARADTPITLNTFHYIARGALLKWWSSLSEPSVS